MKKLTLRNIMLCLALSFFASSTMAETPALLDQTHAAKGLKCASCHGNAEHREAVTMTKCIKCHNTEKLAKKTKDVKPTNPHENRHFGTETDCAKCHNVHKKSENYCGSCHLRFDFVVP
ncbi:cytochrome c3 family protein [Shewanella inventionis]|nr:cytochrome c3 family protein [Shewanella inventionis]MCL1159716.1 cytochrome c3 family protein [Shewanella inventionis]UAL44440.1 cytochrome c3 family protein [Shewanella inventionis]